MPDLSTFILFIGAALVLLLTPGPAVMYIVARSVEQGRLAGVVSASGMSVGTLVHVAAAALGLSAILASSVVAFTVLKYLGAAYLVYLGLRKLLLSESVEGHEQRIRGESLKSVFGQAIVVNVFNPKVSLFFVAFLPQFVDPARSVAGQIVVFGVSLALMGLLSDNLYALAAGSVRPFLRDRAGNVTRYLSGGVYIVLGFMTAFTSFQKNR